MLFGKIDYLNLLPFHVFLKRSRLQHATKKAIEFKKDVPSKLCRSLFYGKVDAAVISSIESRIKKYKKISMGVVAKDRVISVLVRKNSARKLDPASMSSNMLSLILNLKGEVIIGDRALKCYLNEGRDKFYDLGEIWHKKYNLPFVFAKFCCIKNGDFYTGLVKKFLKQKVKIPQYILAEYAKSRGITKKDITWYLNFISYKIGAKEEKAFKIFIKKARKLNFNPMEKNDG